MTSQTIRPTSLSNGPQRALILPNGILGMLFFVGTEIMLFAGLVSAFTVYRSSTPIWPPIDQPRLPLEETALNTAALVASGVLLFLASRQVRQGDREKAIRVLLVSIILGSIFVVFQGAEWVALLGDGLTLTSSNLGSFFYLIIGLHALHAVVALGILISVWLRLRSGLLASTFLGSAEVFWYFVVGVWPVLYWRVYL